jgi:hypothetical protein
MDRNIDTTTDNTLRLLVCSVKISVYKGCPLPFRPLQGRRSNVPYKGRNQEEDVPNTSSGDQRERAPQVFWLVETHNSKKS